MPDIRRPSLSLLLLAAAAFSPQPAFGQTSLLDVLRANKDPLTSSSTLPFNLTVLVDTILPQFPAITAILQDPSPKVFIAPSNSAIRSFTSQDASNVLTEAILRYHIIPATPTVDTSINAQTAKRAFFTTSNGAVIGLAAPAGGSAAGTLYTVTSGLPSQSNIGGSFPSSAVGTILLSDTVFLPPQPISKVISKSSSIGLWAAAIPPDLIPAITAAPKNAVVFAITNDGMTRAATALEQLPAYIREAVWYQTVAVNFSPDPFVSTLLQPGTVVQFTPIKYNSLVAVNASTTQTWTVKGQNATYPSATVTKQDAILTSDGGVIHFIDNIIMPRWDLIPSPSPTTTRPGGSLPTLPGISTPKPSPSSAASKWSVSFIGDTFPVSLLACLLTALVLALFP